jgi:hypothetical protein
MISYQYLSPEVEVIALITESVFLAASNADSSIFEPGEDF